MVGEQNPEEDIEIIELNNDYTIDTEVLEGDIKLASIPSLIILSLGSLALTTLLFTYLLRSYDFDYTVRELLLISFIISLTTYILGAFGGYTWQRIGLWVASNTYRIYTNKFDLPFFKSLGKLYLRFVGRETVLYLEGQALDTNYREIIPRLKFVITLGISQLSFFLMYLTYVWNPLFSSIDWLHTQVFPDYNQEFQIILSILSSLGTLALYLPATFILRDSNLRTWHTKDRVIGQPLEGLRNALGSLIGVGAILTGWDMYQNFINNDQYLFLSLVFPEIPTSSFLVLVDYGILLVVIIIISAPIIYPAALTYNFRHAKNLNKFRTDAILAGVEVGVSKIREPTREEKDKIGDYINKVLS